MYKVKRLEANSLMELKAKILTFKESIDCQYSTVEFVETLILKKKKKEKFKAEILVKEYCY